MDKPLALSDIEETTRPKVYRQQYGHKEFIDGVKIVTLKHAVGEEGDFSELMRLDAKGEPAEFPGFRLAQVNYSTQFPGSIKAWHMHMRQDELWYVPEEAHLLAGLWDVRKSSKTRDMTNKVAMGGSSHRLLYIPRGVAHGAANFSKKQSIIIYFVSEQFNKENPDEYRIPWNALGADFWTPERD